MLKRTDVKKFLRDYLVGCIHGAKVKYEDISGYDKSTVNFQTAELLDELIKRGM